MSEREKEEKRESRKKRKKVKKIEIENKMRKRHRDRIAREKKSDRKMKHE